MDQNKNQGQGHQGQRTQGHGSQGQGSQGQGSQPQNPNRDQAEGERQQMPGQDQSTSGGQSNRGTPGTQPPERGRGSQKAERNSSPSGRGISNRGMDSDEEQEDVPARGSERGDSER